MRVPRISLAKLLNVLQSPIGRMASWPMRNIKTFPSKQMYLYLSLVERKVAESYQNIDRRCYLVWLKWLIFIAYSGQLMVSLQHNMWLIISEWAHLLCNMHSLPHQYSFSGLDPPADAIKRRLQIGGLIWLSYHIPYASNQIWGNLVI